MEDQDAKDQNMPAPVQKPPKKSNSIGIIVAIVLLILVGYGVYFLLNQKKQPSGKSLVKSSNTQPQAANKSFTLGDVASHSDKNSCWLVIDGKIYDVTSFISSHPGGDILLGCGKDATGMFNSRPNDGTSHSSQARRILEGLQIGVLAAN